MNETFLLVALLLLGILILAAVILGAIKLFSFADQQGFVGLAVYVVCWVFFSPIIATISGLIGVYLLYIILIEKINSYTKGQQSWSNQQCSHSTYQNDSEETKASFVFLKCMSCGTTNRAPKCKSNDPNMKCGRCGANLYANSEKQM